MPNLPGTHVRAWIAIRIRLSKLVKVGVQLRGEVGRGDGAAVGLDEREKEEAQDKRGIFRMEQSARRVGLAETLQSVVIHGGRISMMELYKHTARRVQPLHARLARLRERIW